MNNDNTFKIGSTLNDNGTLTVRCHVKESAQAGKENMEFTIDPHAWNGDERITFMMRSIVIDVQRLYRGKKITLNVGTVDPSTFVTVRAPRGPRKTDAEIGTEFLRNMSPAERLEFMASLEDAE